MFLWIFALTFFGACPSWSEFKVPALTLPVEDHASLLPSAVVDELNGVLLRLQREGGAQIVVLTLNRLEGLTIEEASLQVVDQWKLGTKGDDRGVLLIIAKEERRARIEVGRGLEGVLTDIATKQILEDSILPSFRQGNVVQGVVLGLRQIIGKTDPSFRFGGETLTGVRSRRAPRISGWISFLVILFLWFWVYIFSRLNQGMAGRGLSRGVRSHRMGGGSGGFGGFGGTGGFGGGGGGFSGGGSSGSW